MSNVIGDIGFDRDDLTVQEALDTALVRHCECNDPLESVIVIGEFDNGDLFIRSSIMSCAEANFLIDRVKMHSLGPRVVACDVDLADET